MFNMRLLNTSTLSMTEFFGQNIPPYAILSHRWENEELTFQDFQDSSGLKEAGYAKVRKCCEQAAREGWEWAWVDSCCIDKTSSSELSEAINAMFDWYHGAEVCYAYLCDVSNGGDWQSHYEEDSAFRKSKWFTRGWTLQELLAPGTVVFFDKDWVEIGTKSSLSSLLSQITRIKDLAKFKSASVAQKMSWASKRQTTRVEDNAYCLAGLFDINIHPMYGEGERAFIRLQLEILKTSDDESIFAWEYNKPPRRYPRGLLAMSPLAFKDSGDIIRRQGADEERPPYSMTNKGLRVEFLLYNPEIIIKPLVKIVFAGTVLAPLNCAREDTGALIALYLTPGKGDTYFRYYMKDLVSISPLQLGTNCMGRKVLYVEQSDAKDYSRNKAPSIAQFSIQANSLAKNGVYISDRIFHERGQRFFRSILDGCHREIITFQENSDDVFRNVIFRLEVPLAGIMLPSETSFCNTSYFASMVMPASDRVSRLLPCGRSVSVSIHKTRDSEKRLYVVDISLDCEGKLHFPAMDS
jgi:hypothetical protein